MIKLSEIEWNIEVVKGLTFEQFQEKIAHYEKIGKLSKTSDSEVRKFYEKLTGVVTSKKNK
jgi:hypothetical protein